MKKPVTTWRYVLPTAKHDGWAIFALSSDGFFACVSDRGNYAYYWPNHGCSDFREFFLKASAEWSYFAKKLHPRKEYDEDLTIQSVKEQILWCRRDESFTRDKARTEWELLGELAAEGFDAWLGQTTLLDAYEYYCESYPSDVQHFCKVTMGRLADVLRAELAAEKADGGDR